MFNWFDLVTAFTSGANLVFAWMLFNMRVKYWFICGVIGAFGVGYLVIKGVIN